MNTATIVKKLWNYCNGLRDYVEQLTYLLFLKMADELFDNVGQSNEIP